MVVAYEEDDESAASQTLRKRRKDGDGLSGKPTNFLPLVPPVETVDVAYVQAGRFGYRRQYLVYATAPQQATKQDEEARVIVRQHPDAAGNVCSPLAVIFDAGSFVSALTELALTAEVSNARPRLWTQPRKEQKGNGLDASQLFYDTESRDLAAGRDTEESALQAQNLVLQQQLMRVVRTRRANVNVENSLFELPAAN